MTHSAFALLALGSLGAILSPLSAQNLPLPTPALTEPPTLLDDDGARVSVLGYHWLHPTNQNSEMCMPTEKFRGQIQAIKDSNIPVISMQQLLDWRRGEIEIPQRSFLITFDDGWKSVYTQAYPILKEFRMPFTVFLYKNYVGSNRGGRAMSLKMINEMVESGLCTIGSHSVTHPRPGIVKDAQKLGEESYTAFLKNEFGESKRFLEEVFKKNVTTYAYPGGYHTDAMFPIANSLGYDHLFTVKPGKVRRNSVHNTLPRYIILGNQDAPFNAAMVFRNGPHLSSAPITLAHPTQPNPGEIIESRLPLISVDLSNVENLDPDSVIMRVGGFDKVPVQIKPGTKIFQWTVSRPLRQPTCKVSTQWKLLSKEEYEPIMAWTFRLDTEAAYQAR